MRYYTDVEERHIDGDDYEDVYTVNDSHDPRRVLCESYSREDIELVCLALNSWERKSR